MVVIKIYIYSEMYCRFVLSRMSPDVKVCWSRGA